MKITFRIQYFTRPGQLMLVSGSLPVLGSNIAVKSLIMQYTDNGYWEATIEADQAFTYRYLMLENRTVTNEWGPNRVATPMGTRDMLIHDYWRVSKNKANTLFSSAFTQCIMSHGGDKVPDLPKGRRIIVFTLSAPRVGRDFQVALSGNCAALGHWNPEQALVMNNNAFPYWQACIKATDLPETLEYKYVIYHKATKRIIEWESGENRTLQPVAQAVMQRNDERFRYNRPDWKCGGVAIPIFSLRTNQSFGIGDYLDIKKLADWAHATGQHVIQTLPVNDTTRFHDHRDSSPYNSISVFALNPLYINPNALGTLPNTSDRKRFENLRQTLNKTAAVDYTMVSTTKWEYFRLVFEKNGNKVLQSADYKLFEQENAEWLLPYAAFCCLREHYHHADFTRWETYSVYDNQLPARLLADPETAHQMQLHLYLQYQAHKQLKEASLYAQSLGIALKGDLPIGISRDSVEAWTRPELFHLNSQAGAPPDPFSETGQNWGFPTYNWEAMAREQYAWWKSRLKNMAQYFHLFRIDHVLGFFRIWRMSDKDVTGLLGQFDPALALSIDEIRNAGMWFEYHRMVHPYIRDHSLNARFGKWAEWVKTNFLDLVSPGIYRYKDKVKTQRDMELFFKEHSKELKLSPEDQEFLYNQLLMVHCEVLFIEDYKEPGTFHPRIGLQQTASFNDLDWQSKEALNQLYNYYFYQRNDQFWYEQASAKLPILLQATGMLPCAEDLGMIPACVPTVIKEQNMLGLQIERMPKDSRAEFTNLNYIPYLSVCTTGTHDMAPLRLWWTENKEITQRYYNYVLSEFGEAPQECDARIVEKIINRHLNAPAMMVILPMQDWLGLQPECCAEASSERINDPGQAGYIWNYRTKINLEDLLKNTNLNAKIRQLLDNSARSSEM